MIFITSKLEAAGDKMVVMRDKLKSPSVLGGLIKSELDLIRPLLEPARLPKGEVVFEQGSPAQFVYIVRSGSAAIQYKPYDGPAIILTHLHAGDVFGWSAVLGSLSYTSTVITESALRVDRIRGAALRRLCLDHPALGQKFLDQLALAVSGRWHDARAQVRAILAANMAL
jgi:CRP-like cAMP-binding protein